jgi:hypothetical protein
MQKAIVDGIKNKPVGRVKYNMAIPKNSKQMYFKESLLMEKSRKV